jgi:hypothetical protein
MKNETMIITKGNQSISTTNDPAYVFLKVAGGGFNELQTRKAMTLLEHYKRDGCVKYKGFTYMQAS